MTQLHLGWHFCAVKDGVPILRHGSPLEIGREYHHAGPLSLCSAGFHDSGRVSDALQYAPGPYLCRTISSCDRVVGDKRCSRYRTAIAGFDASDALRAFAARAAFCALLAEREAGREPDPRSWLAVAAAAELDEVLFRFAEDQAGQARAAISGEESSSMNTLRAASTRRDIDRCEKRLASLEASWCAARAAEKTANRSATTAAKGALMWARSAARARVPDENSATLAAFVEKVNTHHERLVLSLLPRELKEPNA